NADTACATVNGPTNGTGGTISTPWLTANKQDGVGHALRTSEFFEGGLNLTQSGLGGKCFNVFIGDTRSSQSLTATLFDFAKGVIGECTSSTTSLSSISGSASIGTGSLTASDSATITVNGIAAFNGTVQFYLCGPSVAVIGTPCDAGGQQGHTAGVAIGSP